MQVRLVCLGLVSKSASQPDPCLLCAHHKASRPGIPVLDAAVSGLPCCQCLAQEAVAPVQGSRGSEAPSSVKPGKTGAEDGTFCDLLLHRTTGAG